MNAGETFLTIGALTLLTIMILNFNRGLNQNEEFLNETRFGLETVALATSIIEEVSQLPFDEQSWDTVKVEKVPGDFTLPENLGPDAGEINYATFDDFDDFHNYTKAETTLQNVYNIECKVNYVNPTSPDVPAGGRSYYKRLKVNITNATTNDSLNMNYVHGFWYFN